jgi:tartrate dehydratase alpha subunit/fumarate hydratase class I-like protein
MIYKAWAVIKPKNLTPICDDTGVPMLFKTRDRTHDVTIATDRKVVRAYVVIPKLCAMRLKKENP